MKKILVLSLGAVVLTGIFIREWNKRQDRQRAKLQKPRAEGFAPGRGSTATEPDWGSPFDSGYPAEVQRWLAPRRIIAPDAAKAAALAERIHQTRSGSWFGDDDEAAVEQVFARELSDAVELSVMARKFFWLYQQDMWEYLTEFLSASELETLVSEPVRQLPPYRLLNP